MRKNDRLYSAIKGKLYHSTSLPGYRGIRNCRQILWNDGSFPFSHGQTKCSYCWSRKLISLLDLRNPRAPLIGPGAAVNWKGFLTNHDPITVLLELDPSFLPPTLIIPEGPQTAVTEAEVCFPPPIPVEWIQRCVLVCAKLKGPFLFRVFPNFEVSDEKLEGTQKFFEQKLKKINWRAPFPWGIELSLPNPCRTDASQ